MHKLALVVLILGCSKSDDRPAKSTEPPAAPVDARPKLSAAWFGKTPATQPGDLGKLTIGTTKAEAARLVPWVGDGSHDADVIGARLQVIDSSTPKLTALNIKIPMAAKGMLTEAWGPGIDAKRGGTPVTSWFDPARGVRATLTADERDKEAEIRYEPYTPIAKLLGDGPNIAVFDKPFIGLPLAEAMKNYAAIMDGKAIVLPPTEFEYSNRTLAFFYPNDDPAAPVKSVSVGFTYDVHPKLLADLKAVFEKKWGAPKGKNPIDDKSDIYNVKAPHIEIADTSYGVKTISITVSEK